MTPANDLPEEIVRQVLTFCNEVDGETQVADLRGLLMFITERAAEYPALLNLIAVDEDALTKYIQETGDVPPGVKLIKTTTAEGSNVTKVEIVHGPGTVRTDD